VTLATQGATTPQLPLIGDEDGEPEVVVTVSGPCVLADNEGVGTRTACILNSEGLTTLSELHISSDNARLIDAEKSPFAVHRCDESLPRWKRRTGEAPYAPEASQSVTPPKDENWERV
jgi:hypothetical protein